MNPSNTMNEKITILDLANVLANKHSMEKKDAEQFIKGMFELVEEALSTEKYVKVKGLGVFKLTDVESRESINVNTGERIEIQGHTKISFTPDNSIKELINKPFSHFETVILNEGVELEETNEESQTPTISESSETTDIIEKVVEESTIDIQQTTIEIIDTKTEEEVIAAEKEESVVVTEATDTPEYKVEESSSDTYIETSDVIDDELKNDEKGEFEIDESIDEPNEQAMANNEEIISETSVNEEGETPQEQEEEEKTNKSLILITILLILIIIGGAYWLFGSSDSDEESPTIENTEVSIENTDSPIDNISTQPEQVKTEPDIQKVKSNKEDNVASVISDEKVASISDTLDYKIIGTKTTHTLQSGETIIKVALKYYGAKNYWPYIAKHNEKTIKNANNVSKGTKLLIPELVPKK